MEVPWEDAQLFLAIAEAGSLSAAAKKLRIGQPTVSRRLAELEERLGYKLFRRETAGTALTSGGEKLVGPARKMAEWAGELSRAASKAQAAPSGVVRVAAPPGVAFDFVAPFAAWMKQKYPLLQLEVLSSVHYLDLLRGEADLALRTRAPTQEDLVCVHTLEHENAVFAAKVYADPLPKRYTMADLAWICWAPPYEDLPPNPQLEALIPSFRPAFTSDNFLVMVRAMEAGLGAMVLGRVLHRFSLISKLVALKIDLGEWSRSALHLVAARSALEIPRVRLVADLLVAELERAKR